MSRDLSAGGGQFHTDEPQTAKLLSSYVVLVHGDWRTTGDSDWCS